MVGMTDTGLKGTGNAAFQWSGDHTVTLAKAQDASYSETLIIGSMADYYQKYNLNWDKKAFLDSWSACENYEIWLKEKRVGILRVQTEMEYCYLRDLHIESEYRNQGVGAQVINQWIAIARERQYLAVRLRVFMGNPARHLYQRCGFRPVRHDQQICSMERALRPL